MAEADALMPAETKASAENGGFRPAGVADLSQQGGPYQDSRILVFHRGLSGIYLPPES